MELQKIPEDSLSQRNLLKVKLMRNNIKNIPKEIENLSRLETFDISNNKIIHTYTKLFELKKLKILNLNNNRLNNLPRQIANLKNLKKLQLANNFLKKLPDEIESLQNLTELNISYNKFQEFPNQILKLKALKSIWIGGNFFETLPFREIIKELPNIARIYTYSNIRYTNSFGVDDSYVKLSEIKGNTYSILRYDPNNILTSTSNSIVKKLTGYIIKGQLDKFFTHLQKHEQVFDREELLTLLSFQAQWSTLQNDVHQNTISQEQETVHRNKITKGLLRILMTS